MSQINDTVHLELELDDLVSPCYMTLEVRIRTIDP